MENKETRLQALRVLNEHFKHEGKLGCLEDRQVKLVLDAMIEFRQFGVIKSVCEHKSTTNVFGGDKVQCLDCGETVNE